ncbi:MAG: WD40 repeat domain-containing protein, partial [Myxococcota bacterium]
MTHWIEKHSIHSEIAEATWSAHDPTWSYTHDLTFTADGSRVAAVDRAGTVRTFDTANGTLLSELSTGMSVRLGPGAAPGQVLAVGENRVFVLEADGSTRTSEGRFDRSRAEMLCVLALSDDLVVTGHRDGAIRRWSLAKGAVVRGQFKVKGSSAAVTDLTRTKDGGFLSVSAKVWKWSDDPKGAPELVHEHRRPLDGVFACGDDVFVTGSADVRAWFADGRSLELANSAGARVAACSNGLVYAAYPGRVFLYDYK